VSGANYYHCVPNFSKNQCYQKNITTSQSIFRIVIIGGIMIDSPHGQSRGMAIW